MEIKLDKKDKKILKELDLNCRQSNTQIAKKVDLSKDAVNYRIKNLEKNKIIEGYYALLNITKLGYTTYKLMITFQNTTKKIENEIVEYLKKSAHVGWLASSDGQYNLMAVAWVKNEIIFYNFLTTFLKKYGKYVKDREIIVIIENHACRKAYLFDEKQDNTKDTFYGEDEKIKLNEKDQKILELISNNAKKPLYQIADSLNLTAEAIAHRIKKLQKRNIIQAFRPAINTPLLGYEYYNVLFRLKSFDNIKEIFNFFKKHPNIIYFVKYLGNYDIGIDLEIKNAEELRKVLEGVKEKFSNEIESYKSVLIYKEHKLSYLPKQP